MRAPTIIAALFVATTLGQVAHAAPPCAAPDLRHSLTGLRAGAGLEITRAGKRVLVIDRARDRVLFSADAEGAQLLAPQALRQRPRQQAATEVVRDATGRRLYSLSLTPLGARVLVIEPGVVGPEGLQLITFDDDDLYLSDGRGALLFARHTADDGTLSLSDGHCERRVASDGRQQLRPVSR